jgi:hypothetical protein
MHHGFLPSSSKALARGRTTDRGAQRAIAVNLDRLGSGRAPRIGSVAENAVAKRRGQRAL